MWAGRSARRWAAGLWLAAALVTWNVVFDRVLFLGAAGVAHDHALSRQEGRTPAPVAPAMARARAEAALTASLWGGGVLAAGLLALGLARRPDHS